MTQQTILYIEDDPGSQVLVQRVLLHAGFHVLLADRALPGIDLAKKHVPDLILVDINLPDLSGREITTRLRADPRLKSVPIVALTAQSQDEDRKKAFVAGVTGYIIKPVDIDKLPDQVKNYLAGQKDQVDASAIESAQQAYNQELVERLESTIRTLETSNQTLRKLDQIKDDFIQLTAHELRTPLTTVYGYSRLVQESAPIQYLMAQDPEVFACLTGLIDSIERLNVVINEIVTVSRIASGRVDLKPGLIRIDQIMGRVVQGYQAVINQRRIQIVYDVQEWPPAFYADGTLLELAINNILGNAIKYTPDGGQVTISAKDTVEKKNRRVQVGITDSGIGIDPHEHERIFDRFYTAGDTQLHSTSKTAFRGGGLGLGLAICRGIVEAHHGKIWVESEGCDEENMPGSTFFIELPAKSKDTKQLPYTP
ncbi:MAG: hybrid sensor histidine kinase/response regulator [Anaerolineae bacterium]|nr:hybrid sensor histidine kinase/response regulator [Anaerolineae bacterium]